MAGNQKRHSSAPRLHRAIRHPFSARLKPFASSLSIRPTSVFVLKVVKTGSSTRPDSASLGVRVPISFRWLLRQAARPSRHTGYQRRTNTLSCRSGDRGHWGFVCRAARRLRRTIQRRIRPFASSPSMRRTSACISQVVTTGSSTPRGSASYRPSIMCESLPLPDATRSPQLGYQRLQRRSSCQSRRQGRCGSSR